MQQPDRLIGAVIDGKYEVTRLVGQGGMGAVYAGIHLQLDRPVAVKTLRAELLADPSAAARFAREARAAARIEHPNAVHVYDFGQLDGGGAYLVMEYVEGVSLRAWMRDQGLLPVAVVVSVVGQIAAAVAAAHARGIVHRDLKPENVMVREEDGRPVVKVVDFGLAKLVSSEATSQITRPSELLGTPKYMAPEQFASEGLVDERVDVYALGVVLYEILAGRTPFEGTFNEVVGKHLYADPPPIASVAPADVDVSRELEEVARRALAKNPVERTPTAAEFARELAEAWSRSNAPTDVPALPTLPLPGAATSPDSFALPTVASPAPTIRPPAAQPSDPSDFVTRYAERPSDESTRVRAPAGAPTREQTPPPTRLVAVPEPVRRGRAVAWAAGIAVAVVATTVGFWASRSPAPTPVSPPPAAAPVVERPAPVVEAPPPPVDVKPQTAQPPPQRAERPARKASSVPAPRPVAPAPQPPAPPQTAPAPQPPETARPDGRRRLTPAERRLRRMIRRERMGGSRP
jgi:eukaryotic-like serine/threonine-protein kinase